MSKKDLIEILFGVKGGGEIAGASGKNIKKDLTRIANQIKLDVKFNDKTFSAELKKLKKELEKELGTIDVKIDYNKSPKTKAEEAIKTSAEKEAEKEAAAREKLIKEINKQIVAEEKLAKASNVNEEKHKIEVETVAASRQALQTQIDSIDLTKDENKVLKEKIERWNKLNEEIAKNQKSIERTEKINKKIDKTNNFLNKARDIPLIGPLFKKDPLKNLKVPDEIKSNGLENAALSKLIAQYNKTAANAMRIANLSDKGTLRYSTEAKVLASELRKLASIDLSEMNVEQVREALTDLKNKTPEVETRFHELEDATGTLGNKIRETFDSKIMDKFGSAIVAFATTAFNKVYQNVVELDRSITDLQIATGKSRTSAAALVKEYSGLAQQLGATTLEVSQAADTWLRQGYSAEESTDLIRQTMHLSKLGQMESYEASVALTSAMKGYGIEANECSKIVDKLTAVDMEAAASAGDLATAMAETAVSAKTSGVSMDTLIGYIATVKEVTQDGAESVGTFFRTMFARMNNIKIGRFVDDETGESLNDVANTLASIEVNGKKVSSLYNADGSFRDFEVVISEIGEAWGVLDDAQRNAIASAIAGSRQQEKFKVLMENYGDAMGYASVAADSLGTAAEKFESAYLDSIEAKMNQLKSAWEEFSMSILDSDLIIFVADTLKEISTLLTSVSKHIDLSRVAMVLFGKAIGKIATNKIADLSKSFKELYASVKGVNTFWGKTGKLIGEGFTGGTITNAIASVGTLVNMIDGMSSEWSTAIGLVEMFGAATIFVISAINAKLSTAGILGVINLALTGVMTLISGIKTAANETVEAFKKAGDAAKDAINSLEEVTDEYKELSEVIADYKKILEARNKETDEEKFKEYTEELKRLYEEIVVLAGDEYSVTLDINGAYEEQKKLLEEIAQAKGKALSKSAKDAYAAENFARREAFDDKGNFLGYSKISDIGGIGTDRTAKGHDFNITFGNQSKASGNFADTFRKYGFDVSEINRVFGSGYGIEIDDSKTFEQISEGFLNVLSEASGYRYVDTESNVLYQGVEAFYNEWIKPRVEAKSETKDMLANSMLLEAAEAAKGKHDPLTQTTEFVKVLQSELQSRLDEYGWFTEEEVKTIVSNYMAITYPKKSPTSPSKPVKYTFKQILDAMKEGYSLLREAEDEYKENGFLSADYVDSMFGHFSEEQIKKYFQLTADGYKINANALNEFIEEYKKIYGLEDNEGVFNQVLNTLRLSFGAEDDDFAGDEQVERWEEEIKLLEEELNRYEELIEERKELLQTYKEELEYQKSLEKKQKNVADLRTRLSLAKLDNSAAGKARQRGLQKELEEAEEDLDDFTLEHAIDVLTKEIDSGYDEYKKNVDARVKEIKDKIDELKQAIENRKNGVVVSETHHTGGIVGATAKLKSSEVFAKLLKGEVVSTPRQINNFINKTLPSIAARANGGTVTYNAPLIEVKCDTVTKETLPNLEKIIEKAAKKIKDDFDSVYNRKGSHRREIK